MRRRATEGDEDRDELAAWLREGYATAYRTAYGLLRDRSDAEDAVQEAFLRAWRFRAAIPPGDGVQPWLYRVVVNACMSKLRRDGRRRSTPMPSGEGSAAPSTTRLLPDDPERSAVERETHDTVLDALRHLSEPLRVVVVLRYYGGLSEKEIAAVIHRRPGTVKSRMHGARSRLAADPALGMLGVPGDVGFQGVGFQDAELEASAGSAAGAIEAATKRRERR